MKLLIQANLTPFFVTAAVAVSAGAGAFWFRAAAGPSTSKIIVSGNIELQQVDIAFKVAGRITERTVEEGDRVSKGMVIARLDQDQILRQIDREQASRSTARAQLAQAETSLELQQQNWRADLELRQADVNAAEAKLREVSTGARPGEVQDAAAAVEGARAEFQRAESDYDRARSLRVNGDISYSQLDQYRSRYESSRALLKQTEERLGLIKEGPRRETVDATASSVERARAALKVGQSNALELRRRAQEITARRTEIERTQAQIALVESQLSDTVAVSPINGTVLVKAADVGEVIAAGTPVVTVGDLDHPWMRAYLSERDLGRVRLNSPVRVTTDSYPRKYYKGRVVFISPEAEFTPKQIQTTEERIKLVYRIKIEIDNSGQMLKANMPVDAEILLEP
jgi:HlyD family secretion protein